jgi:hypothetical protein
MKTTPHLYRTTLEIWSQEPHLPFLGEVVEEHLSQVVLCLQRDGEPVPVTAQNESEVPELVADFFGLWSDPTHDA